ncbi:hypothetical protein SAMN05443634_10888 [Chishuiella changwenlii]|uniref:Uncharacterized protein n=1 Tax=Chishuiella changwenlii TaxID=1434701 RepID=A0A1M6ZXX7_9FLAO|nr:hypothetical protein [Chishuiella changwenlii]GGE92228.1 hypothetical protein GCM10010984_07380 [Chishuiella changwenlii]SHL35195.1 hypothetical protein SAMN05443634_10888 [Chishuiella changwenlii]
MNTAITLIQTAEQSNQLDEVLYLNPKNKKWLIDSLSNNRKFEFLMFNLWKTRGIIYNILQDNYDKKTGTYLNNVEKNFGNQFHAINNLIGILLDGTDWNQSLFVNNEPTEKL